MIHLRSRSFVERWPSDCARMTSLTASALLSPIVIRPLMESSASGVIVSLGDDLSLGGEVLLCSTRGGFFRSWTCGPVFRSIRCRHRFITATERNAVPHGGYSMARLAEVDAMYRNTFISVSNVPSWIFLNLRRYLRNPCCTSYAYSFDNGVSCFRYRESRQSSSRTTSRVYLKIVS